MKIIGKIVLTGCLLILTTNCHSQWITINSAASGKLESVYFHDASNGIFSSTVEVVKTSDAGGSFTPVSVTGIRDIDFANTTTGYAAGFVSQSLKKTTNGGTTWTPLTPINSNSLWAVSVVDANTVFVSGTGGVVWKSTNGGTSFSAVNVSTTDVIVDIHFFNSTTGCALGQTGDVYRTTNGGSSWTNVYTTSGLLFTDMYFVDSNTGYAVGSNGQVVKSSDGGVNWSMQTTGTTSYLQYVHFYDPNNGIACGYGGVVIHTVDGGANWLLENTGVTNDLFSCVMLSPTVAIAAGDAGFMMKNSLLNSVNSIEMEDNKITIYPNPNNGTFRINSDDMISAIEIYNINGQLIYAVNNPVISDIEVAGIGQGIYFTVISNETSRQVKTIVVE